MAALPEASELRPPASVVKIVGFLADVRGRQSMGGRMDLNEAWNEHDITLNHVDDFLGWLNLDRSSQPKKEMDISKAPKQQLAKKAQEPEDSKEPGEKRAAAESEEPAINVHLWNALFRPESRRRRRNLPQAPNLSVGNRASGFANGYNGNFMLATLALGDQQASPYAAQPGFQASPGLAPNSPEAVALQASPALANGLASRAFGERVANRAEGIAPLWNDPLRRDLLPTFNAPNLQLRDLTDQAPIGPRPEVADPLFGQVTLIAPPITVSPETGQGASAALKFDWRDMAKGAGLVDRTGMATLAKTLPAGSQVLYPAIDPRKLRGGAVNLRLEPRFAVDLAAAGYGNQARVDGRKSARLAADWYGGTPPSRLLPASLTPLSRPGRRRAGMSPDNLPQGGAGIPAEEPNRRMRFLDFLGLPIYLSPQLNTSPDLEQESRARISAEFMPRSPILSPASFGRIRANMLGGFYGVEAKPELGAWRRSTPDYERAGAALSGILSNRLRTGALGEGVGKAATVAGGIGRAAMPGLGGMVGRVAAPMLTGAALSIRSPLRPSPFAPPSMPSPAIGSTPQPEVPRFIRHDPARASGLSTPSFRPTIPAMPQSPTAPRGQGATAPQPPGSQTTRISPQFNVTAERPGPPPRSIPARQSMPSAPPAPQPAPMEGPKPARAPMIPQATSPRPGTPQTAERIKPTPTKSKQPMVPEEPKQGSGLRPPSMLVTPAKAVPALKADNEPLAIQTSTSSPAGAVGESAATRSAEVAEKKDSGLPGSEINLLANEVWILLKRRLSFEAQRMGR